MGIQRLKIGGFRSLRDVSWAPGKLNVVIGQNASGKSNLIRALEMLRRSSLGTLADDVAGAGGMTSLLWDGQANGISWEVKVDPVASHLDAQTQALTYELWLKQLGNTSSYRIQKEQLANYHLVETGAFQHPKKFLERAPGHAVIFDAQERKLVAHEGSVPDEQTLLSLAAGPFGNTLVASFRDSLSGWSLHHDVRVDPQSRLRQAPVARLDARVDGDGQNLISVLHTLYTGNREFKRAVDDAMRVAFDNEYEELVFPPAADQRVQLRVRWRSLRTAQSAADLSDGTVRFLFLLAVLANPNPAPLIAIDEPEAGLHPSMLPLIAEHAVEASRTSQVILTTHSAQLLDAFPTRPTTTVARWEDGETRLSVIDDEELTRWLKAYSLGSLFRSGELEGIG